MPNMYQGRKRGLFEETDRRPNMMPSRPNFSAIKPVEGVGSPFASFGGGNGHYLGRSGGGTGGAFGGNADGGFDFEKLLEELQRKKNPLLGGNYGY